jgi:hypothetical protein
MVALYEGKGNGKVQTGEILQHLSQFQREAIVQSILNQETLSKQAQCFAYVHSIPHICRALSVFAVDSINITQYLTMINSPVADFPRVSKATLPV